MKRTIEIRNSDAYYRGRRIDELTVHLRESFGLKNSRVFKYEVTIVEGTQFRREKNSIDYFIYANTKPGEKLVYRGIVCQKHFDKLFFEFDVNKTYDITVKKIRK